ncbi:uncharacterized protein K452DRAFT_19533 [Aplosporella prunicola CBS 121167]|uniref:C2H2-type domain-containing protein n=1 Tax=Aplosporella prunicola CBS 121167 TaxID=1176127 RepID=A0A6A6BE84_9PEZI|nr:uncharacterized protein K452DRAFT_19533 [Aplosporella prunicola CBS 121167]KAF2142480.1 hypothetical protein K452DRAFT_19533 [Aplosporella prunicola CBS 121167]
MLACYPRRQYADLDNIPSPTPSHLDFFNHLAHSTCTPSPSELPDDKQLRSYFPSSPAYSSNPSTAPDHADDQYMTSTYDFSTPTFRMYQPAPAPQLPGDCSYTPLIMDPSSNPQSWDMFANNGQRQLTATTPLQSSLLSNRRRSHQKSASTSTVGSTSTYHPSNTSFQYYPTSEQTPSTPSISKPESSSYSGYNAEDNSGGFSNHLPTPSHTPTQDTFANGASMSTNGYTHNNNKSASMAAHLAMKQALMDQHQSGTDGSVPDFGHSSRQSVSSFGADSPATPHNAQEDYDFKIPSNDIIRPVPKLDRTMTDIYVDELYNPNATVVPSQPKPSQQQSNNNGNSNNTLLSPYRNIINDRLQAAHNARSQSPSSTVSRGASPFRQGSPLAPPSNSFSSSQVRLNSAQQMREQQKTESQAYALQRNKQPDLSEPKTISPKDALLDYHESDEDSKMPLFPDGGANDYDSQYHSGDASTYDGSSDVSYGSTATSQGWSNQQATGFPSVSGPSPPQSTFNFAPPSVPGAMNLQTYSAPQYRPVTEHTPEFVPKLTSMESSASEALESSQTSQSSERTPMSKPSAGSGADTGTYTCTYHGCTQRFETPQKLQKHKREGHRPAHTAGLPTPGVGSGMTSAALLARNSQAGPHKCERINPTTGKPCNTIFSRPYDLTRHEDTIHNARKQKVRCALCVEEKTFSRNDALTRHMRVVHPDVDFPGKHRRRGGAFD